MRCSHCRTNITKIPISWKCPSCGEKLPEPGKMFYFYEHLVEYLPEKGVIFWTVWFTVVMVAAGVAELMLGRGYLLSYLGGSMLMSIIFLFFGGMLIEMVLKINLPMRLPYGTDYILRERVVIRNIRKATNLALLIGLIYVIYWLKPRTFFIYFPAYLVTISWFLALAWSIVGLFLDARMIEDVRFRFYMDRLGITSLKQYRRLGALFIGLLVLTAVGYHILISIPGIWKAINDTTVAGAIISFLKEYLAWLL